jgi:glycosyltransferase involved in cell wall biosynthesis
MKSSALPLVSVICLCYQHEKFVKQALESIILQTYPNLQILITDDKSTDNSKKIIQQFLKEKDLYLQTLPTHFVREIEFDENITENIGNCKRFNMLFQKAKGKYIIDFATDDIFLPEKIETQVQFFEKLPEKYGVVFTNAWHINEKGEIINPHFKIDEQQKAIEKIPEGDILAPVLRKYFICTPTMMIKKDILEKLGGYDENLSYEDFDFWVRSSQLCEYAYFDVLTTLKRDVKNSHAKSFYHTKDNQHLASTLVVLKKALPFCLKKSQYFALRNNTYYHLKQCFWTENFELLEEYDKFLKQISPNQSWFRSLILFLGKRKVKLFWLYQLYLKIRFRK